MFGFKWLQKKELDADRWFRLSPDKQEEILNAQIKTYQDPQGTIHEHWMGKCDEFGRPIVAVSVPVVAALRNLRGDDAPYEFVAQPTCGSRLCVALECNPKKEITIKKEIQIMPISVPKEDELEELTFTNTPTMSRPAELKSMPLPRLREWDGEMVRAAKNDLTVLQNLAALGYIKAPKPPKEIQVCVNHGAWMTSMTCALASQSNGPCSPETYSLGAKKIVKRQRRKKPSTQEVQP